MSRRRPFIIAALFLAVVQLAAARPSKYVLWYRQPAAKWTDALPIGNGRMGAMVFGGIFDERIQFNEDTLWTGHPHEDVRAGAHDQLTEIRRLLAAGQAAEAEALVRSNFLDTPIRQNAYQPFGDLHLHFPAQGEVTDYRRELDLESAVATTSFQLDGVRYKREIFASYPDHAIVMHLRADKSGRINFSLKLDSPHTNSATAVLTADTLSLTGQVEAGGLRFESRVRIITHGGKIIPNGNTLTVTNADYATLILVAATGFKNFQDITADPAKRCKTELAAAAKKDYATLLATHFGDHHGLFGRVKLDLGHTDAADLPTDERLQKIRAGGIETDPALAALYFEYGRYRLIASSRAGGQAANLQGLWNEDLAPPRESNREPGLNCEMNYWPAEAGNLSECASPLFDLVHDLAISGVRTATEQYDARGWVAHQDIDLWRGTASTNDIGNIWPAGGAWLCYQLWEHYLFTGDKKFLTHAYPAMRSAAQFFMDALVKDPKTGWLVSSPSFSPETGALCLGPAMDHQVIRALMDATLAASTVLDTDKRFAAQLASVRSQLAPDQIGKHGQLQQQLEDTDVPNNDDRPMSPLFALYPGAEITPAQTNLYAAAKALLQGRGDGSTGWSCAWRMPLWARVSDGDSALHQFNGLLQKHTLPNLFELGGPSQTDGNFGACAGVAEMLLQSQQTLPGQPDVRIVELLPALPKAWPDGSVTGLCARGGFEINITWHDGKLAHALIHSQLGEPCVVRYAGKEIGLPTRPGTQIALDSQLAIISN